MTPPYFMAVPEPNIIWLVQPNFFLGARARELELRNQHAIRYMEAAAALRPYIPCARERERERERERYVRFGWWVGW